MRLFVTLSFYFINVIIFVFFLIHSIDYVRRSPCKRLHTSDSPFLIHVFMLGLFIDKIHLSSGCVAIYFNLALHSVLALVQLLKVILLVLVHVQTNV